ncbi:PIG-L deacetylase family protein [uncultured Enterovirga sp.]|uniref:PIG-L deacetylase family protein n=1 Tax=uncultured Enterovirga sp. TaxID=2026352 RepID=UPI0035CB4DE2
MILEPALIVVAHPDDETLGCGVLLPRLANLAILHVTDGAPRDGADARRHGFPTPQAYAAARREELATALAEGGVAGAHVVSLDIADQGVAHAMSEIAGRLVEPMRRAEIVFTHALEGGHPDHDATAFVVRAAARLLGPEAPALVEMPFYRADPAGDGWLRQSFGGAPGVTVLRLTEEERRRKQAMLAAHASQAGTLAAFGAADESFRTVVPRDVTQPDGSQALYDRHDWGITSAQLRARMAEAAVELGLSDAWL